MSKLISTAIAVTAALAFVTAPASALAHSKNDVKCYGVNACKGKGACKANANSCKKGSNECKGKGFKMVKSEAACTKLKGSTTEPAAEPAKSSEATPETTGTTSGS